MQAAADATPSAMVSVIGLDAEKVLFQCKHIEHVSDLKGGNVALLAV